MPFRHLFMTLAMILGCSGPALAECEALLISIGLAEQSFATPQDVNQSALADLEVVIGQISNEALLLELRRAGRAQSFGDLRNFLTQLRFLSRTSPEAMPEITERIRRDIRWSRRLIDAVCENAQQTGVLTDLRGIDGTINPAPTPQRTERTGLSGRLQRLLSPEQQAILERTFDTALLMRLFIGVTAAVLFSWMAHYGLLFFKVIRRNRRTCAIPAELTCMMTSLAGHVTTVGQFGCTFTPISGTELAPLEGTSAGTYCTLSVGATPYGAKLTWDIAENARMLFTTELSRDGLRALLSLSEEPVRYDLSVVQRRAKHHLFGTWAQPKR